MKSRVTAWPRTGRRATLLPAALAAFILTGISPGPVDAQEGESFLMVKLGDEAATPEMAGGFLTRMGRWLERTVPRFRDGEPRGWIANREAPALELLRGQQPSLAFVPVGFHLGHLVPGERPAYPVAQIPRFGSELDRYYLVTAGGGPSSPEELRGRTVRTHFAPDEAYLRRVVFPEELQPGTAFHLEGAENLADELFSLLEGGADPPAALLLDEELKRFFEADDLVWPELQVIWRSPPLPRELVVALGGWEPEELDALREALLGMPETPEGREVLELLDSSGFQPVPEPLLEEVRRSYREGGGG